MAQAVITKAEDGRRKPVTRSSSIPEEDGTSWPWSAPPRVSPDRHLARSAGKLTMAALGAELTLVPSEGGSLPRLILDMIETARELSRARTFWTDQPIIRTASPATRRWPRRFEATKGEIDAFVIAWVRRPLRGSLRAEAL
jgi:hypothetical protein